MQQKMSCSIITRSRTYARDQLSFVHLSDSVKLVMGQQNFHNEDSFCKLNLTGKNRLTTCLCGPFELDTCLFKKCSTNICVYSYEELIR